MSTKSRKKVGFTDDVQDKSQRESRSRSRSRFKDRRARSQDVRSNTKTEPIPKKRERSLVALVRTGSQKSVRNLVKLFETRTISTKTLKFLWFELISSVYQGALWEATNLKMIELNARQCFSHIIQIRIIDILFSLEY
ncbi:hypothetical protein KUTeg_002784 [Tegillarca granosa]|uniref:Uncharacterized protein n=1 Tax=Tegillarca granosa TaxID=220873 RepID=A0ABQ9FQU6_TEGGR|nr:hypothetical protein KUTeg_002784 [Tegillarca granosa]